MQSKKIKPPIPVEALELKDFARLALAFVDIPTVLWTMKHKNRHMLALFTAYTYWKGDLPIMVYINKNNSGKPFLAYKSDSLDGEICTFEDSADNPRFKYSSFMEIKKIPDLFKQALDGNYEHPQKPLLIEVHDMITLVRMLLSLSVRDESPFHIWHFRRNKDHVMGAFVPFEHYYDFDAIPMFFYYTQSHPPKSPFVRYSASKSQGEKIDYVNDTSDSKFFYSKIINVKDFPIFP